MSFLSTIQYKNKIDDLVMVKHPVDDVFSHTEINVLDGQEAVVYENGKACLYTCGKEPILGGADTEGFLLDIISLIKRERPFPCSTFIVEKTRRYPIEWGANDLIYNLHLPDSVPFRFGLSGTATVEIVDSVKLVEFFKEKPFVTRWMLEVAATQYIAGIIRNGISQIIRSNHLDCYYIEDYMAELSYALGTILESNENNLGLGFDLFLVEHVQKIGEWVRPATNPVSSNISDVFHGLTPAEKKEFITRFTDILKTKEDIRILNEITNERERG